MAKALKNINELLPDSLRIVDKEVLSCMTGHSLRVMFINMSGEQGATHEEIGRSTKQSSLTCTVTDYEKDTLHFSIQAQLKLAKAFLEPDNNLLAGVDISTPDSRSDLSLSHLLTLMNPIPITS
jgi:hypothetical protein